MVFAIEKNPRFFNALTQGFLTWGESAPRGCWNQFQGWWGRPRMWRSKVCPWAFL